MDRIGTKALNEYMDLYDGHQTHAAQAIDISAARLNQILTKERPMSIAVAARIHAVTHGALSMYDLSVDLRKLERGSK